MAFVRRVKTSSGATTIQIAHKEHGRVVKIEHIGSAHTDKDVQSLIVLAKLRLQGFQQSLFKDLGAPSISIGQSVSSALLDVLDQQYDRLGFSQSWSYWHN